MQNKIFDLCEKNIGNTGQDLVDSVKKEVPPEERSSVFLHVIKFLSQEKGLSPYEIQQQHKFDLRNIKECLGTKR